MSIRMAAFAASCLALGQAQAQVPNASAAPVTADNFVRAESDTYAANLEKEGGLGILLHCREPAPIQSQTVIRLNRDTLYTGVFDLDAGPVTITLPDAGQRFMSLQVISEDHYATTEYGAGPHILTRDKVGTRYAIVGIRTLVDPTDSNDLRKVHALQDMMKVDQASAGTLEMPAWDAVSQKKVRDALLVLATTLPDTKRMFGTRQQVDPVRHLIGSASAWGGNNENDALYLNVVPSGNDGKTVYRLNVKDVPVDGFGRSASTMPRATTSRIRRMPTRSTTSPPTRVQTAASRSSSAPATARSPTASRRCRAGTTWSGSIARARRS